MFLYDIYFLKEMRWKKKRDHDYLGRINENDDSIHGKGGDKNALSFISLSLSLSLSLFHSFIHSFFLSLSLLSFLRLCVINI